MKINMIVDIFDLGGANGAVCPSIRQWPSDYYYLRGVRTLFKHINGLATNHIVKFILYILPNY